MLAPPLFAAPSASHVCAWGGPRVVQAKDMCLRYAAVEKRLGEIDRARAVLVHGSQLCDPRTEPGYWQVRVSSVSHGALGVGWGLCHCAGVRLVGCRANTKVATILVAW